MAKKRDPLSRLGVSRKVLAEMFYKTETKNTSCLLNKEITPLTKIKIITSYEFSFQYIDNSIENYYNNVQVAFYCSTYK